jgi:hypothetical protein
MNRRTFFKWAVLATGATQVLPLKRALADAVPDQQDSEAYDLWALSHSSDEDVVKDETGCVRHYIIYGERWTLTHKIRSREMPPIEFGMPGERLDRNQMIKRQMLPPAIARALPFHVWQKGRNEFRYKDGWVESEIEFEVWSNINSPGGMVSGTAELRDLLALTSAAH